MHDGLLVPVLWDLVVSKLDILVRVGESGIPGSAHTAACIFAFNILSVDSKVFKGKPALQTSVSLSAALAIV